MLLWCVVEAWVRWNNSLWVCQVDLVAARVSGNGSYPLPGNRLLSQLGNCVVRLGVTRSISCCNPIWLTGAYTCTFLALADVLVAIVC